MTKSIIEQELEKQIAHRHIQGDKYYCEFCRVNSSIQKALEEAEKMIKRLCSTEESSVILMSHKQTERAILKILNDCFGVGK